MATKKAKAGKRSKKRAAVKDLSAKSASSVKGGAAAGDLSATVKFKYTAP